MNSPISHSEPVFCENGSSMSGRLPLPTGGRDCRDGSVSRSFPALGFVILFQSGNPKGLEEPLFTPKPEIFGKLKALLQKEYDKLHRPGGKPPKLTVEDKLKVALK
jgi:hypothetical protein